MHGCPAVLHLPPEFNPGIEGYRLVVPDDHFGERVALQEPLADVLELLAIKRQALAQFGEGGHQPRRLREGCLAVLRPASQRPADRLGS